MPTFFSGQTVTFEEGKTENLRSSTIGIRATKDIKRGELKRVLDEAAEVTAASLRLRVPRGNQSLKQYPGQTIAQSIDAGERASYKPGGAGGGGSYSRVVGFADPPEHLEFVMEGTGIYGEHATPIVPTKGNLLVYRTATGWHHDASVKGQPANREWFDDAWKDGIVSIDASLKTVLRS